MNGEIEKRACFTGHRVLGSDFDKRKAYAVLERLFELGVDTFICGGAMGYDIEMGELVLKLKKKHSEVKLWLFLPCTDQDAKWRDEDKKRRQALMARSDLIDCPDTTYNSTVMKTRNYKMVDNSYYCIAYFNGQRVSGTAQTVRYAKKCQRKICNLSAKGMAVVEAL